MDDIKLLERNEINIIDLALIPEIEDWAYSNCTREAKNELIRKIRIKLETLLK